MRITNDTPRFPNARANETKTETEQDKSIDPSTIAALQELMHNTGTYALEDLLTLIKGLSSEQLQEFLSNLDIEQIRYVLEHIDAEDLARVLASLEDQEDLINCLKNLIEDFDKQIDKLDDIAAKAEYVKNIIKNLDPALIKTMLGQLQYQQLKKILGQITPEVIYQAFSKLDPQHLIDMITHSQETLAAFLEKYGIDKDTACQLMNQILESIDNPEAYESLVAILRSLADGSNAEEVESIIAKFFEEHINPEIDVENEGAGSGGLLGGTNDPNATKDDSSSTLPRALYTTVSGNSIVNANNPILKNMKNSIFDSFFDKSGRFKGNVMKFVLFAFMGYALSQQTLLSQMAEEMNEIKKGVDGLNEFVDAMRSLGDKTSQLNWETMLTEKRIYEGTTEQTLQAYLEDKVGGGFKITLPLSGETFIKIYQYLPDLPPPPAPPKKPDDKATQAEKDKYDKDLAQYTQYQKDLAQSGKTGPYGLKESYAPLIEVMAQRAPDYFTTDANKRLVPKDGIDAKALINEVQTYIEQATKGLNITSFSLFPGGVVPGTGTKSNPTTTWSEQRKSLLELLTKANSIQQEQSSMISATSTQIQAIWNTVKNHLTHYETVMSKMTS